MIESEGSVEICLLLTGGVMSEDTDIILEVSPVTARSGSERNIDLLFHKLCILSS